MSTQLGQTTRRFPPSGSSADVTRGDSRPTTFRSLGDMSSKCQSIGHGSLPKFTPTRAAFARPGPGVTPFPDVVAPMQPSDSLPPSATALVPLACGLPRCGRFFCASEADNTCARERVVRRRLVTGSPQNRDEARRGEGLPGYGAILFVRAMVEHPAGYVPRLAHLTERLLWPSGNSAPWASGKMIGFGAATPWPTRSHAYASPRPFLTPSQGLLPARAGSPFAGRVSHPLDDTQSFMESLPPPIPFDPQGLVALNFLSARVSGHSGRGAPGHRTT